MPLINCEINLILTWSKICVLTSKPYREAVAGDNSALGINAPANSTFTITDKNLYVPVVTLSTQVDNKLLEQFGTGFKRTIK